MTKSMKRFKTVTVRKEFNPPDVTEHHEQVASGGSIEDMAQQVQPNENLVNQEDIASGYSTDESNENDGTRGPTLMTHIWEIDTRKRIFVQLSAEGLPLGEEGTCLTRFIGSAVRKSNLVPLSNLSWNDKMYDSVKENVWAAVESKFSFSPTPPEKIKDWVLDDAAEYKAQRISNTNRQNRLKYKDPHCLGTKTYAQFKDEKKAANNGVEPSRSEIYIASRRNTKGEPVSVEAAATMKELENSKDGAES